MGVRMRTCCYQARNVGHVREQVGVALVCDVPHACIVVVPAPHNTLSLAKGWHGSRTINDPVFHHPGPHTETWECGHQFSEWQPQS